MGDEFDAAQAARGAAILDAVQPFVGVPMDDEVAAKVRAAVRAVVAKSTPPAPAYLRGPLDIRWDPETSTVTVKGQR